MANAGRVPSAYLSFLPAAPPRRREMILIRMDHELTVRLRSGALKRMFRGERGERGVRTSRGRTTFAPFVGMEVIKSLTQWRSDVAV